MPRSFGLDALRVSALFLVLFAHGCAFWMPGFAAELVFPATICSFIGVDAFFVLSGFLIGRRLLEINDTHQGVVSFWKRRWARTLPNYYLFLLISFCVMGLLLKRPIGGASYWWFGQNLYAPMQVFFFPESWSLAVEMWFYLLAPLLMLVLPRAQVRRNTLVCLLVGLLLLGAFAYLRFHAAKAGASWDEGIRKIVLLRLDALIYGVMAAGFSIYAPTHFRTWRKPAFVLGIAALAGLVAWAAMNQALQSTGFASLSFSLSCLGTALLLPFCASWQPMCWHPVGVWVERLSRWSYSCYLVHLLALFVLLHYAGPWMSGHIGRMSALSLGWLILSIASAGLVYRFYEKPLMDLATSADR